MRPQNLFTILCLVATLIGTQMYVKKKLQQSKPSSASIDIDTQKRIDSLEAQIDLLERDNQSLKQLLSENAALQLDPALITFVEKNLELRFARPPIAIQRSPEMLRESAAQLWLTAFGDAGIKMRHYAFETLGILPPNQNFIGQCISADTTGAVGVYDYQSKEIVLATHFDPENTHHQASVIRLLAIALLDQSFPLKENHTDDLFYSHLGLTRARASQIQDRFYTLQARHNGFIDNVANTAAIEAFASFAPYVKEITQFSNTTAKDFLASSRHKTLSDLLTRTPLSTHTIYTQSHITTHPTVVDHAQSLSTTLGFITVKGFLRHLDGSASLPQTLKKIQPHYQSDLLTITVDSTQASSLQWLVHFDSTEAATAFHTAAQTILESMENPPSLSQKDTSISLIHTTTPPATHE